ncbi:hypothetical protein [Candidatus Lokiarchaeum ossiferum]|uniref:hypothetical protein n=1 Tax=Candidatus Lokiarchaeum ossiferum TaxID=2951803 RepID=UPI00352D6F23
MSIGADDKDDLLFIFIGQRGLQIGSIFFNLIKDDYKGKRYDILDFFSKVFFICETESQFREIGTMIEGYVPEENVLLMGELNTSGDLWSNIEENDDIFASRVFAPLMYAVDQLAKPNILLFYDLSNGKQAGICDYLLINFPLVKQQMPIYVIATTSIDEGAGALSIYWSILGLNSIIQGSTAKACILLDYEAIGNSIFLKRIKKMDDIDFESYNYVVAQLIYSITYYDREPYSNAVPFCQMIDKLVIFNDMKFIIPFMTMPRRELIEDETFSGYLNELVNDCNLFSMNYKRPIDENGVEQDYPKISLANAFIAFGEKQDTHYLNLIRNNLPPIMEYLPGTKTFYTYPRGDPFSVFLENNTVVRQYFQDLLEKFDILISHHSYLHVLEDLGITVDSFSDALDKLVSIVDAYQESEDLLYDDEEFDYEEEISKYDQPVDEEEELKRKYGDTTEGTLEGEISEKIKGISDANDPENNEFQGEEGSKPEISSPKTDASEDSINKTPKLDKTQIIRTKDDEINDIDKLSQNIDAKSISNLNEQAIKQNPRRSRPTRTLKLQKTDPILVSREGGRIVKEEKPDKAEGSALGWLEMRANKEKEKVQQEKAEITRERERIELEKREFEEAQELIRLEEEKKTQEETEKTLKKKEELKELAKMFENL